VRSHSKAIVLTSQEGPDLRAGHRNAADSQNNDAFLGGQLGDLLYLRWTPLLADPLEGARSVGAVNWC
jgi:hypothetical protein